MSSDGPGFTMVDAHLRFQTNPQIPIFISASGPKTLALAGEVVWAREGPMAWLQTGRVGMGIRFIDPPSDLAELAKGYAGSLSG